MRVATRTQMREMDRKCISDLGIPGLVLMENAGLAVYRAAGKVLDDVAGKRVLILCGRGNNGGDGFVAARHLLIHGAQPRVLLLAMGDDLKGDALTNYRAALACGVPVKECGQSLPESLSGDLAHASVVIDALLGTGTRGEVTSHLQDLITRVNESGKPVISVDIPSGLDADTGKVLGAAVRADLTVTFGLPKPGLLLYPGADYAGQMVVDPISMPLPLRDDDAISLHLLERAFVRALLPTKAADSHKGDWGRVLVLAGSLGYTGAAALTCMGAHRMGSGLVYLAVPESLNSILEGKLTETITLPMPETGNGAFSKAALEPVLEFAQTVDALAVGPGIGRDPETLSLVRDLLGKTEKPVVLDASGLEALSLSDFPWRFPSPLVITPHPGELARSLGKTSAHVQEDRLTHARLAEQWGVVLVLKGARTLIASPGGEIWINPTGNSGMATAGSGDVLTGMIASLVGQGLSLPHSALAGAYLHGLSGDLIAGDRGPRGLIASDLADNIPSALRAVLGEESSLPHLHLYAR